jgi:hypothetical protein
LRLLLHIVRLIFRSVASCGQMPTTSCGCIRFLFVIKSDWSMPLPQRLKPGINSSGTAGLEGLLHPARVYKSRGLGASVCATRCSVSTTYGEEMGRNDVSGFVCNESRWGHMGRNRVSSLEMGTSGRGRGIRHHHRQRILKSLGIGKPRATATGRG